MILKKRNTVLVIIGCTLLILLILTTVVILRNKQSVTKPEELSTATIESLEHTRNNVFVLSREMDKTNKKLKVYLSLEGEVSVCNFKLGMSFDTQYLKLLDYDNELSVYSPTVYPEKNDTGIQWERGINDVVEMTWASAKNRTVNDVIISFEFEVIDDIGADIPITLSVEEIGTLNDSFTVVQPAYEIAYNWAADGVEKYEEA